MHSRQQIEAQITDLEERIARLTEQAAPLREQIKNIDFHLMTLNREANVLRQKHRNMSSQPRISDHAVIRYLERKYGFSFEKIRAEMMTPVVREAVRAGATSVKLDGGVMRIKDGVITTYIR